MNDVPFDDFLFPFDDFMAAEPPPPTWSRNAGPGEKQLRWEHHGMRVLLDRFGLTGYTKALTLRTEQIHSSRSLSFQAFKEQFPDFPLWLCFRKVRFVHELTMVDFVKNFTKNRLYQAFVAAEADAPAAYQEGRLGLVFEWLHTWPVAILHNHYRSGEHGETVISRRMLHTDPPQIMAIQSFPSFLESLRWTPGE